MTALKRGLCILLTALLLLGILPPAYAAPVGGRPGNLDLNINNGGVLLQVEDVLYACGPEGISVLAGEETRLLTTDAGRNLNYADGYLYYTCAGGVVRRLRPETGGAPETLYTHDREISRLYVMGGASLLFVSDGRVYTSGLSGEELHLCPAPDGVVGLIPTVYGNLYLTGEALVYSLWAEQTLLLEQVTSCYTDSGFLAVLQHGQNWQIRLERLFDGFDPAVDLELFHVHGEDQSVSLFALDDVDAVCPECEARATELFTARLMGLEVGEAETAAEETGEIPQTLAPEISDGQRNMVLRARQLHEIQWTPLADRYQWGGMGVFHAETSYTGLPYGQPVNAGYVPWTVSLEAFLNAVNDSASKFYTIYSTYNKTAPCYSCDCSAFVSYAWGLQKRHTTRSLPSVAELVGDQSIYSLQVGDALNKSTSHVVLVSDVQYNTNGELISVEIMEQTPAITKLTRYGEGGEKTLARLQSYYLDGGYVILRDPARDAVQYTHSCAVPIDGDYCMSCAETAPKSRTTAAVGEKAVELYHEDPDAVIYYTTDGTAPHAGSTRYTQALTFSETTPLRAIAVSGRFSASRELKYTVTLPAVQTPAATITEGLARNGRIALGSRIRLHTETAAAQIYYTTDSSDPAVHGSLYSEPIPVTGDVQLRAVARAVGMHVSETAAFQYTAVRAYVTSASAGYGGAISPAGETQVLEGDSQTFLITADAGFAVEDVLVDGVSVGKADHYTLENVSGSHSISVTFRPFTQLPFEDVGEENWFYDAVSFVYGQQLFSGTSAAAFSPNTSMTRGMFVTVLGRYAGVPADLTWVGVVAASQVRVRGEASTQGDILKICEKFDIVDVIGEGSGWYQVRAGDVSGWIRRDLMWAYDGMFTDVAADKYYSPHIAWASLCGLSKGIAETSYAPDQAITREQMCVLLYNYMETFSLELPSAGDETSFSDEDQIAAYAREAVHALQSAGVISGLSDGRFDPKGTATRAQVAQIMYKTLTAIQ